MKYIYSIYVPYGQLDQAKKLIQDYTENNSPETITVVGIDECYMKSYKSKLRTICEICVTSEIFKSFDELWAGSFGKLLRNDLGFNTHQLQRRVYSVFKRPSTYKFKPIEDRIMKTRYIPF